MKCDAVMCATGSRLFGCPCESLAAYRTGSLRAHTAAHASCPWHTYQDLVTGRRHS